MYRAILRNSNKNALQKTTSNYKYYSSKNIPVRQAGFGKFIIFVSPIIATGGVITYAKYDNEFRKTIVDSVPGADYVIKVALREEKPFENLAKRMDELYSSVAELFGAAEPVKKEQSPKVDQQKSFKSGDLSTKGQDRAVPTPAPSPTKPEAEHDKQAKARPTSATSKPIRDSAPIAISRPSDAIPKDIIELERAVEVAAAAAVQEYDKAIRTLRSYNEDVNKVLDQAIERADLTAWTKLKNKTSARDTAVESAEEAARQATQKIEQCELALSKVATSVSPERLQAVRHKIKLLNEHITGVKDELYRTKDSAELSEKYWRKIERARNYFIDEIESIFPGLNLAEKKLNLPKDDLDLFIMHAYSHVLAYQKELQRLQLTGELKLKRAIEALRGENQDHVVKAQLDYYLDKEKRQLAIDNQKRIFQIRAEADKELRTQLKRQAEAHVDHIQDALSTKESELRRSFMRELDEKLSVEKAAYKLQLATMLGKLKGMDAALRARAESEKCAHQAQALWAACQALWASMRTGDPDIHWQQKLRPLQSEIKAVSKAAAKEDELVNVLLQNLPEEARTRGVYPEDALRERFFNVEKVARKVALVPEEGASIPIYLLSYLQSVFVVRPSQPISKDELQDKKIDFSTLDTYDILNRARYCLDRGDLMQALKYMNLLQGAPRKIARDWLKEVRLLLETQQAANTLMAHAAASGLLYL